MPTEVPPILTVVRDKTALAELTLQGLAAGILAARQATAAGRAVIHDTAVTYEKWEQEFIQIAHEEGSDANACETWDRTMHMLGLPGRNGDGDLPISQRHEVEVRYPVTTTVRTAEVVAVAMSLRGVQRADFIAGLESRLPEADRVQKAVRYTTTYIYAYADDDGCVCDWVDRQQTRDSLGIVDPDQHARTRNCPVHRVNEWEQANGKTEAERAAMLARRPIVSSGFDDEVLNRIWPKLTAKVKSVGGSELT